MKITVVLALVCVTFGLAVAQDSDAAVKRYELDIPQQPLDAALKDLAQQTGLQIARFTDNRHGSSMVGPVRGEVTAETALDSLLASTGLEYSFINDRTVAVASVQKVAEEGGDSELGNGSAAGATPKPVMMAQAAVEQGQTSRRTETDSDEDEKKRPLEEIIVTGTLIRGIAPESSPTRTFDREDIQITGAATAQDFIQTLPGNFGGGSNPDVISLPNDANAAFNSDLGSFGSSVNLRGLGSGSTLVLINGRRVAPSSGIGDFVDISMIPASALERVEVVSDGSSAIYGADAIAGVVNFVLRDDFDGLETSLRYGTGTQNGTPDQKRANVTGGKSWGTGHAMLAYEFFSQTNLSVADRSFTQNALEPDDLLPREKRHSALASVSQELTPKVKLFSDVLYSEKEVVQHRAETSESFTLNAPDVRNLNVSVGGAWEVFDDWVMDISGTYSRLEQDVAQAGAVNRTFDVDADIWMVDGKASGTMFSAPGGDVKLAIGGHYREEDFSRSIIAGGGTDASGKRDAYAFFGEVFIPLFSPDNAIPGVERLEINASGRVDHFDDFGTDVNPKVGIRWSPFGGINFRGSYGTSFNPPPLGRVGAGLSASALPQAFFNNLFGITPADPSIADVVTLLVGGSAKNLGAETSTNFTGGFDLSRQEGRHHLNASATYFDVEFEDRLGSTPIPQNRSIFEVPNIAFVSPDAFPPGSVIFFPTTDQLNDVLDSLDIVVPFPGVDPQDTEIIQFTSVIRNLARTIVRGIDFDIAYTYGADFGDLSFGLDGTYLKDHKQQGAVTTPLVEQVDTRFNPVDLKLRGRAGYSHDGFAANIFVNYTDNYRADNTPDAAPIDSWTTIDISLSYDTKEEFSNPYLNSTVLRLSVLNLFDDDPPAVVSVPGALLGFDPTNASPLNRFVAVELAKRF